MKVVGISGSPRTHGNAEALLEYCLAPFRERGWGVSTFFLSNRNVAPCTGCEDCAATGRCSIPDDMTALYGDLAACQVMVIASPVYYRNVPAQLKAVFDRSYAIKDRSLLAGTVGGAIAVGRGTGGGQGLVLSTIHNFYLSMGVVCVPGELNGVSAVADRPGDILFQTKPLSQARILGENLLWCAERMAQG
jgi:multimeric flavodoxin WrbA